MLAGEGERAGRERHVASAEAAHGDLDRRSPGVVADPAAGHPPRRRNQPDAEPDPAERERGD